MLYIGGRYDIIIEKYKLRINIMNRNTIISLAMLYALWQSKHQDLLDLIQPFILCAVGTSTKVGEEIDIEKVCASMEEFGYKSFQPAVVNCILKRESSSKINGSKRKIAKKNGRFILVESLSTHIDEFNSKRTDCKGHSDAVTIALANFLNQNSVYKRSDYTQVDAEVALLSFFERQGGEIVSSVEDLRQITSRNNEMDYFIAKFILAEHDKKSVLMDYIVELVKGYFVTNAIYLQVENPNITTASFKDVTFYLDTRLLLGYLGYKTEQENKSIQEMVQSLRKNGAKIACFAYNIDEVNKILTAYKQATTSTHKKLTTTTLEYFDEHGYSFTHVEAVQRKFEQKLKMDKIDSYYPDEILEKNKVFELTEGLLDDERIKNILLSLKPNYNLTTLPDDLTAVNTISRVRRGKNYPYIERCRAVFVTSNTLLVTATKKYLKEANCEVGFPIAITAENLCVLAWIKDFEKDNNLPQMRLLENVLAAMRPSGELMESYFSHLEHLEELGEIDENEAALLRVDMFARQELMELTRGEKDNLNSAVVDRIRQKIRLDSHQSGYAQGKAEAKKEYERKKSEQLNKACRRAEEEVEKEFQVKENKLIRIAKKISVLVALAFIGLSIVSYVVDANGTIRVAGLIVAVISIFQGALPFFSKNNWLTKCIKNKLKTEKLEALDKRKEQYMSLVAMDES